MGVFAWITQNGIEIVNITGIVGGLLFTAVSLHSETKTRRVANLLVLTENHRELWRILFQHPELGRILDPFTDIKTEPVSRIEEVYVTILVQHLSSVFRAMKTDLTIKPEGIRLDVRTFFSLPVPRTVWERIKLFQDRDFTVFVDSCVDES